MTAEIVIMNKEAIALAADSAVTHPTKEHPKIFTSANKIFALSKYHPVGIMIYGNANFMGSPWETIIKVYRDELGEKVFDTLKEYVDDFIDFLKEEKRLSSESEQEKYVTYQTYRYFYFIREEIIQKLEELTLEKRVGEEDIEQTIAEVINEHYNLWSKAEILPSIPENHVKNLIDRYGTIFDEVRKDIFEKFPVPKISSSRLSEIGASLFAKSAIRPQDVSGVVVAGFGEKEVFPSFQSLFIEGIAHNVLKYWEHYSQAITFDMEASISRFAQSEMVATFIEGVAPDYENEVERYLRNLIDNYPVVIIDSIENLSSDEKSALKQKLKELSDRVLEQYLKELSNYRREKYVDPVIDVVAMLPKDELASMAESLVNLASFKKKVTTEEETVGGPIDVALISKGDGFIWIKRKHYFKPELNPQFFTNYYRRWKNEKDK
ncbi:MAG: hypothetical protein HXS48_23140 [Theionarchaea archaeon]|nr:MAG: hypothetical protein AYK19_06770 [Theionarchaea archaeon DG-70-1]MBU7029849.1 hypothetical protein [Theionarchaea archaeon]